MLSESHKETSKLPNSVQVGQMGCGPACGRNGNSLNVSLSQPSLHRQRAGRGLYKW